MISTYEKGQKVSLNALLLMILAVGFIGYCFMVITLAKIGNFGLPFDLKKDSQSVVVDLPVAKHHNPSKSWSYNFNEFPDGSLSSNDWNFEVGNKVADINNEAQTYTSRKKNIRVEDGALVIEARRENLNNKKYSSARIDTKGKFDFQYGTLEIDAMLPKGIGTWPAAWLLPANAKYDPSDYGIDKKDRLRWAINGEIDVLESVGFLPNENYPNLHSYNEFRSAPKLHRGYVKTAYTEYHRYGMIKTPSKISFTLDGIPYYTQYKESNSPLDWPFDQAYYLIINLTIGGSWGGATGVIDDSLAPWQMKIKSISYEPLKHKN